MSRSAAVVPAAGRGSRIGFSTPKTFIDLGGVPLLARTLAALSGCRGLALIQPVLPRTHLASFASRILARNRWGNCRPAVAGGRERQDSVAAGLRALPDDIEYVLIHDGARPFVTAALAAVPVQDTVKRVSPDLFLDGTVDRRALWLAQTPQAFQVGLLREAHARAREAGVEATDDAALVEALGHPVCVVPGSRLNFKITTREDLALARALVAANPAKRRRA